MDIHSWRVNVPTPPRALELDGGDDSVYRQHAGGQSDDSDSDGDLPALPTRITKPGVSASRPAESSAAGPRLVSPKQPATSALFIPPRHPSNSLKKSSGPVAGSSNHPKSTLPQFQYRQPREVIEIEDSPPQLKQRPPKSKSPVQQQQRQPQALRQPLTEISSSSSDNSLVQLVGRSSALSAGLKPPAATAFNPRKQPSVYEPLRQQQNNDRPASPAGAGLNAKARIYASYRESGSIPAVNPMGIRPSDPTLYASHSSYRPPQPLSDEEFDAELSRDLDPEQRERIKARAEADAELFRGGEQEQQQAMANFCSMIDTDMSKVVPLEAQPAGLKCELHPHQMEGVAWLKSRELGKARGGILADDMGLGKTVQSIGLLLENRPIDKPRGTLIVGPVALLYQWRDEISSKTTCNPKLRILLYHGEGRLSDPRKIAKYDVVLTSYQTLSKELPKQVKAKKTAKDKKQKKLDFGNDKNKSNEEQTSSDGDAVAMTELGPLLRTEFHRVILDESHTIKNPQTVQAKACYRIQAKYRWCLTGTPVQNSIDDLFSLFHFLGPTMKPLNNAADFKRIISMPLKNGRMKRALERLHAILSRILLRRTKQHVNADGTPIIKLPPREVEVIKTDFLDDDERTFYDAVEKRVQIELNKFAKKSGLAGQDYIAALVLLLRLRQICNHPDLVNKGNDKEDAEMKAIKDKATDAAEQQRGRTEVDDLVDAFGLIKIEKKTCTLCQKLYESSETSSKFCGSCKGVFKQYTSENASTKIIKIIEIILRMREDEPDRKAIIFSQFTSMFAIMTPFLKRAKIKFVKYEGSMRFEEKQNALDKIRDDPSIHIILVSLKCGAQGLNLTCCSTVFMVDLWWNPAIENQAIDRAHRIGQTKTVKVYKFIIVRTVEERILKLQEEKKAIADAAIDGGSIAAMSKLGVKQLNYLFGTDGDYDAPPGSAATAGGSTGTAERPLVL